ncbi:hypothetical protein DPMN_067802 [Dreissena polymorpha]|uniref:Uncharacterized protein n=1 Tax=Dreissena polymorpha TaxID=45954 RepID=A0A9D3YVX7_DREPO|nr:hypothetical protein DPMN_067802 [Dreissena polymorpha]
MCESVLRHEIPKIIFSRTRAISYTWRSALPECDTRCCRKEYNPFKMLQLSPDVRLLCSRYEVHNVEWCGS